MYQAGDRCVPSRIIVLMPSSRKAIIRISSSSARPGLESAITENSELDIDLTFFPAETFNSLVQIALTHRVNLANSKINILNSFSPSNFILDCLLLRQFYRYFTK